MKNTLLAIIVIFIALAAMLVFSPSSEIRSGGTSNFDRISLSSILTTGGANATTTSSSTGAITISQVEGYSLYTVTPASTTVTLTLPASSTMTTFIPNVGDVSTMYFRNATSVVSSIIVIASSTGTTVKSASTTSAIRGSGVAEITFIRTSTGDVTAAVDLLNN